MIDFPLDVVNKWSTRKGRARKENLDTGGVYIGSSQIIAVLVDAAERGLKGAEYSKYWVNKILVAVQKYDVITYDLLITEMKSIHGDQSIAGFVLEMAAYAVLVIDNVNGSWAINCGDCRIGSLTEQDGMVWLTPVHTMANFSGEEFSHSHADMPGRHRITRRLRLSRFDSPELTKFDKKEPCCWLLGTDGYWVNQSFRTENNEAYGDEDDASLLILDPSQMKMMQGCENFFVYKK